MIYLRKSGGNATVVAAGTLIESLVQRADDKATAKENAKVLAALKPEIIKLKEDQGTFLKDAFAIDNDADLKEIFEDINKSDHQLAVIINSADQSKKNAFYAIKAANTAVTLSNLNQVNNALKNMNSSMGTVQSSAVTAGSNTTQVDSECMKQATEVWKASTEYKNYKITKLNAEASLCKAKLLDLTIQYCGSQLSAKEIAEYKRISTEEKQIASDLRNGSTTIK